MEHLIQRGRAASGSSNGTLISAAEAERMIESLQKCTIAQVGSSTWLQQHEWVEQLNLQAHFNAQAHSDEFVMELFASLDRINTIVHNLLVVEAWKEHVFPILRKHIAQKVDPIISYIIFYNEAALANLLEVVLFHKHACQAMEEDYLLELCDWCYRKLHYLNTDAYKHGEAKEYTVKELMNMNPEEELEQRRQELELSTALASLTILRYLSDHAPELPMGLVARLVSTNDTIMALIPLLDKPPWTRHNKGKLEQLCGNQWKIVQPSDRLKIGQHDAQVWLALNNLLVDPKYRAKYDLDDYRKNAVLKLKRFMNELLFDQIPVLKDLQRVLDESALNIGPQKSDLASNRLVLEQVPVVRMAILAENDWEAVAKKQKRGQFGEAAKAAGQKHLESILKNLDFLCDLQTPNDMPLPQGREEDMIQPVKFSCWRKVKNKVSNDVFESWCDFMLEVNLEVAPDPVQLVSEASGAAVHGLRYRLKTVDPEAFRPFPTDGKVVVVQGRKTAEALLQLPTISTRDSTEGPAALWLTVGILASDGFVIQLKLRRAAKPQERDRAEGVWYAYHPTGGAITLLRE